MSEIGDAAPTTLWDSFRVADNTEIVAGGRIEMFMARASMCTVFAGETLSQRSTATRRNSS
jgi:hypothetical protein